MEPPQLYTKKMRVALLTEGVDRNSKNSTSGALMVIVALLTEGVDRNFGHAQSAGCGGVALLTEGVDRNILASPSP